MNERDIILGCKANDKKCQEALVKQYSDSLLSVSYRYSKDIHEAKDHLQDAFIIIFKEIKGFRMDSGSFEGWMKRIVARSAVKKYKRKRTFYEFSMSENVRELSSKAKAYDKLKVDEVLLLIKSLPDGFREVLNLHVLEGYSFQEISNLLNITDSSVRSRLSRARKTLIKRFEIMNKFDTNKLSHHPLDE